MVLHLGIEKSHSAGLVVVTCRSTWMHISLDRQSCYVTKHRVKVHSCPPDKELGALTKWLASQMLVWVSAGFSTSSKFFYIVYGSFPHWLLCFTKRCLLIFTYLYWTTIQYFRIIHRLYRIHSLYEYLIPLYVLCCNIHTFPWCNNRRSLGPSSPVEKNYNFIGQTAQWFPLIISDKLNWKIRKILIIVQWRTVFCTVYNEAEFMNIQFRWGFWAWSWEFSDLRFPYTMFSLQTSFNPLFLGGGGGGGG